MFNMPIMEYADTVLAVGYVTNLDRLELVKMTLLVLLLVPRRVTALRC